MRHGLRALAVLGLGVPIAVDLVTATAVNAAPDPACASVTSLLDSQYGMFAAYLDGDATGLASGIEALPDAVAAVRAEPPSEIAADVAVWLANADDTLRALEGVTDPDIVLATMSTMPPPPPEFTAAQQAVERWAGEQCGWSPPTPGPADCRVLDASAAAAAAGLEIDTTAPEAVFDGGGPGFATQACSYGSGTLALTTVDFDDRDDAADVMVGMATSVGGGHVIAVDLGTLPDTAVVIEFAAGVQVVVLDADVPFAVTVAGVEPSAAVASAEAVWASVGRDVPDGSAPPGSTR